MAELIQPAQGAVQAAVQDVSECWLLALKKPSGQAVQVKVAPVAARKVLAGHVKQLVVVSVHVTQIAEQALQT